MAIAYVGKAFVLASASGTSIAVPMPSGLVAGHKLYVLIGSVASNATGITAPAGAGFLLVKEVVSGSNLRVQLYSKTAVAGDAGTTYTWTSGNSGRYVGYSVAYSGVDTSLPDLADATSSTDSGLGPWTTPSLSLGDGDWLLSAGVGRENPGTATTKNWTSNDGADTERFDNATTAEPSINIASALFDSARPLTTGTVTRALSQAVALGQSQVWAVRIPALAASASGPNPWSSVGMELVVQLASGILSAGPDVGITPTQTFAVTATEPTGTTITARKWEIISGPLGTGMQIGTAAALSWKPGTSTAGSTDIRMPTFTEIAYEMTSTAENSTLDWTTAYRYIQDINDQRGYTAGLVGFCSATGDMLQVVQQYAVEKPGNALAAYLTKLQECTTIGYGSGATAAAASKLGAPYIAAWQAAADNDPIFRKVQRDFRKAMYFDDALTQALADGVGPLGLAIYYDVLVNHGVGTDSESFGGILAFVRAANTKPSSGGNQTTWLNAVINRRDTILKGWGDDQSVDGRVWMHKLLVNGGTLSGVAQAANLNLVAPIKFACYGDPYNIAVRPDPVADALLGTYVLRYTATGAGTDDVAVTVAVATVLSAGPDTTLNTTQTFAVTATEPTSATITARKWEIISGPLGTGMQIGTAAALSWKPGSSTAGSNDIRMPTFTELAYQITSTAENSTLAWTTAYRYIEDINDQRGYTAGLVGFCSATGDMLQVVQQYAVEKPGNALAAYITKLQECTTIGYGSGASAAAASKLGTPFITGWQSAADNDPVFRKVQRDFRKSMYFNDALTQALADGVGPLGLCIYYDILVNHGVGTDSESFGGILAFVRAANTKPSSGGNQTTWLNALINRRDTILKGWGDDQSVDGRVWMHKLLVNGGTLSGVAQAANLNLVAPIKFACYGDPYNIAVRPDPAADALLGAYVLRYTATGAGTDDVQVTVA